MACKWVNQVRYFIQSVAAFTNSQVDIIGYSMGALIARKAQKGGNCADSPKYSVGDALTQLVNTFITVAAPNNGALMCLNNMNYAPCIQKTGMRCNSTFLNEINSAQRYEASNKIYTIFSQTDEWVGYIICDNPESGTTPRLASYIVGQNAGFEFQSYDHGTTYTATIDLQHQLLLPNLNPAGITTTPAPTTTACTVPTTTAPTTTAGPVTCEFGWTAYSGFCYKADVENGVGTDFHNANSQCQTIHSAQLASIHSDAEANFVHSLIQTTMQPYPETSVFFWIGLQLVWDDASDTVISFNWTDSSANDYPPISARSGIFPWNSGEPTNSGDVDDCVQVVDYGSNTYRWNDGDCSASTIQFNLGTVYGASVCKKLPPVGCGQGWVENAGFCYLADSNSGGVGWGWEGANQICEGYYSARLASIHSDEEQQFVASYLDSIFQQSGQHVFYWIGLRLQWDDASSVVTNVSWTDRTAVNYANPRVVGFSKGSFPWAPGQPDNSGGNEDCGMIWGWGSGSVGAWTDLDCAVRRHPVYTEAFGGALCKKPVPQ